MSRTARGSTQNVLAWLTPFKFCQELISIATQQAFFAHGAPAPAHGRAALH
jgi:hypothetical protein